MRQWLEAGYFKGDLPISQKNTGPFRSLLTFFPDLNVAFQPTRSGEEKASAEARARAETEAQAHAHAQAQAQAQALAAAKREQEAREKAAAEAEMRARAEAEAEARSKAEAERKARAEAEAMARAEAAANAKAAAEAQANADAEALARLTIDNNGKGVSDRNEQSAQLKMMLGLGGSSLDIIIAGPPQPEQVPFEQPMKKQQQGQKVKTQQQQHQQIVPEVQASAPEPTPVPMPAPVPAPIPAWGGAASGTTVGRKKSMSEIQLEEARAAARRVSEQGGSRNTGTGWANVAASGGTTAWGGAAVRQPVVGVVTPTPVVAGVSSVQKVNTAAQQTWNKEAVASANKQAKQQRPSSNQNAVDNFGANGRMTPTLENWCKEQMQKLNGSDDMTLVSFQMIFCLLFYYLTLFLKSVIMNL